MYIHFIILIFQFLNLFLGNITYDMTLMNIFLKNVSLHFNETVLKNIEKPSIWNLPGQFIYSQNVFQDKEYSQYFF